jgi:transposase
MMHHGVGWRAMPREHGSWQTLYSRYRLWVTTGVWPQIVAVLRENSPAQPSG